VRISDDRYSRDWRRYNLVWRLVEHEARTGTIQRFTGWSKYRIQTLLRAYSRRPRHRGSAPSQPAFFSRGLPMEREAAALAAMILHLELIHVEELTDEAVGKSPTLHLGERLLDAYDLYCALMPGRRITFEHLLLLIEELTRRTYLVLERCATCESFMVIDRLATRRDLCAFCRTTLPKPR
jgi:hypothetical protein